MDIANHTITGAGARQIAIDVISPASGADIPLVIFVHGFKGFKDWGTHQLVASKFADAGIRFLKFNFSHNGIRDVASDTFDDLKGFAENTFSKELYDLHHVLSFACSGKAFPLPSAIFIIGHSLGGGVSIIQASEDKRVSGVITWASVSNFRKLWPPQAEVLWRQQKVLYFPNARTNQEMPVNVSLLEDLDAYPERLDIQKAASSLTKPFFIVHGDADTTVPLAQAEQLHHANPNAELFVVPDADHVFNAKHPWLDHHLPAELDLVVQKSIDFVLKYLKP